MRAIVLKIHERALEGVKTYRRGWTETLQAIQEMDRCPGGHLKFPHSWPGQIPPPSGGETDS